MPLGVRHRATLAVGTTLAAAIALFATSAWSAEAQTETLVVDRSFEIRTSDPQRAFEPTASIVDRAIYDTLLTFKGADVSRPLPMAAQSFRASRDAKTYTFQLRRDIRFADGTPMTAADVVFSFRRLINLKGNPSFLLAGVKVSARGKYTVVLRSATPNTALPVIVANTSLGIVNSKLAKRNGATDAQDADKTDRAEQWFNSAASRGAGSGPYLLRQYSTTSQIVLEQNPRYWGRKPAFERVVIRNMVAATQFINVQRGRHEVAIDLSAQHAQSLRNNRRLTVRTQPSTWVFWLFANNNPEISAATPNKRFQNAVRAALDYPSFVELAGAGAIQARGIIPSMFLGALPPSAAVRRNLVRARSELAASGVGDQTFTVEYPSDLTINGVAFATLAQRVQANLQEIGIKIELAGAPVGTWLDKYRNATMAFGLSLWGPDFPDPADYLAFMPGELVGTRVGWPKGSDPALERLAARARVTTSDAARAPIYRQIQQRLNQTGPYFPLIQPTQVFAATNDLRGAVFNPLYSIDVRLPRPVG
ncbi:MAG: ABC transporter substrate-binding protein [Actinobacteria bacterium]|nr:ABC transporter substrate-binding protein [Actinomycetota bacterium]